MGRGAAARIEGHQNLLEVAFDDVDIDGGVAPVVDSGVIDLGEYIEFIVVAVVSAIAGTTKTVDIDVEACENAAGDNKVDLQSFTQFTANGIAFKAQTNFGRYINIEATVNAATTCTLRVFIVAKS